MVCVFFCLVNRPKEQQRQQQAPVRAVSPDKRTIWARLGRRVGEVGSEEGSGGGLKVTLGEGGGEGEGEERRVAKIWAPPKRTAVVRKVG